MNNYQIAAFIFASISLSLACFIVLMFQFDRLGRKLDRIINGMTLLAAALPTIGDEHNH